MARVENGEFSQDGFLRASIDLCRFWYRGSLSLGVVQCGIKTEFKSWAIYSVA